MKRLPIFLGGGLALMMAMPGMAFDTAGAFARSGAYFSFQFGGPQARNLDLHYGLKFGRDSRVQDLQVPPVLRLDFTGGAIAQASLGGLPLLPAKNQAYSAAEEAVAAPPAGAPWYDVSAWGATQWGVVVGGGIIGYVFSSDRRQSGTPPPVPKSPGPTSATGTDVCAPGEVPSIGGGCVSDVGGGFTSSGEGRIRFYTREDSSWLDEGTGQMGDLLQQ